MQSVDTGSRHVACSVQTDDAAASVLDSHGCRLDPDGIVRDKQSNLRACDLPEDHPPEEVVSLMAEYARTTLAKGAGLLHGPISAARDAPAAWQCNDWSSRGHICVLLPSPAGGYGGLWSRSVAAEHGVVAGSALPYTDLCEAMGWGCLVGDPGAPWEDPDAPRRYAAAVLEHAVAAAPEASLSVLAYGPAAEHVVHALGAQTDLRDRLRAAVFLEARCSALAARNTEVSAWLAAHALGLRSEPDVPFGAVLSDDVARAMAPLLARAAGGGEETESVRQTVPAAWRAIVDAFARAGADVAETPCLELSAGRETGPGGAVPANPNPAHTLHRCCEVALAALFALGSSDGSSDGDGDGDGDGNSSGATECRGPAPEHASNASTGGSGADAGAGPATPRPGASPSALSATLAASRREAGVGTDSVRLRSLLASASHLDDDSWGEGEADWYCAHACASPAVPLCRWQLSVVAYAREALCLPTPHIGETALPGWRWLAHAAQGRGTDAEGRALAVPVLPRAGLGWVGGAADETGPLRGPVPAYAAWRDFSHTLPSEEWPIFAHPSLFDLLWEDGVWGGHRGREALAPEPRDPASDPAADGDQPPPLHVAAWGGEVAVEELRAAAAAAAEDRSRSASVASSLAGTPVPSRMVTGGDLPPTIGAASVGSEAEDGSSWSLPPYLLRSRLHRASRSNMGAASMPSGASTPAPATDGPGTGPMLLHGAKWTEGGSLRPQAVPLQRYLSAGRMSTFEGQARGRWTQGAEPPPRPRRGKSAGAVDDPALRTAWVPDANAPSCQVCNEGFTVLRRRHHCRACGHVVCARCSEARLPVPGWGSAPVRVCALCEGALAYGRPRGVTVHDFDLLKVLGRGQFGKVLLVRRKQSGEVLAMKVLRKTLFRNPEDVERLVAERDILAQNSHPFVASLKYAFQTRYKVYLVTEYLPGGDLFTHIQRAKHFSVERTRLYAAELVAALGHLHAQGIVYRDLKPENILLDAEGHVRLIDFGLAKFGVQPLRGANTFVGSPEYTSPEVLTSGEYGRMTDLWSLGMVIYEMLTGLLPFYDKCRSTMYMKIVSSRIVFHPSIPRHARRLLRGLLTRDPARRLGARGFHELEDHPFFAPINWSKLMRRQVGATYVPRVDHPEDVRHVDPEFAGQEPVDSPVPTSEVGFFSSPPHFDNFEFTSDAHAVPGAAGAANPWEG